MRHLKKYFKEYRKEIILAPSFKLLEALMDLLVPLLVAAVINEGITKNNPGSITGSFLLMILLAVLGLAFSFTAQWFSARASVGIAAKLRQELFDHIQSFSYTELDSIGTDTLITRMTSDINQIQNGINLALRLLLRSPFIVFGAMIMAFTIDVKSALIFAGAIPVLSLVVFGIMFSTIPMYKKVQAALDRVLLITRENLTGVRVIRAFCKEEDEVRDFDRQNEEVTRLNIFVGRISAIMNPATYVLINIAAILLIYQGAIRVNSGNLLQGDVVALYNYMAQIIVELIKLANLIVSINKALASAERVSGVLDIMPSMKWPEMAGIMDRHEAAEPYIRFSDVSFAYEGAGAEALTGIDFNVKKGQTVGIIGGTGSGKSTLGALIPRFYDVTKGEICIKGRNVKDYPREELLALVGVVPQKAILFSGTIRENLCLGKEEATDEELQRALETARAKEVVEGKPRGLDERVEQNGKNFSGGQKQRLTIARALVKDPEILILDDSASALDFATDAALRKAIAALPGEKTLFVISQRTSSIKGADLILVLDDGILVGKGTHESLMKECPVYQEIYYSQFPEENADQGIPMERTDEEEVRKA